MADDAMRKAIIAYIIKEYIDDEDEAADLDASTELIASGLIDSFSITSIRNWLEKTYDVKIPDELGTTENFATVDKIVAVVNAQKAG
ncbi:MAG: phosphopantetheine-binding protein [Planctomycetota bacterium]